jgi:phosphatidylinositol alpha-1,6-mannosyltransferase
VCSEPGPRGGGVGVFSAQVIRALASQHDVSVSVFHSKLPRWRRRALFALHAPDLMLAGEDLLFYCHLDLASAELGLQRLRKRRYAVFLHGMEAWIPLPATRKRVVCGAWRVLANSQTSVDLARKANPWWPQTKVVHLGVDDPGPPHPRATKPGALMLGRMDSSERMKGHDVVLDSWPAVTAVQPGAELWMVGEGDDVPRLQRMADERGLRNVSFLGFVSDARKRELLEEARVLLLPSRQEGFGLAAVEAAAAGVPVIALRNTALEEVFGDCPAALLADQATGEALAKVLVPLMADGERARQAGAAVREFVTTRYLFSHFQERLLKAVDV